MYLLSSNIMFFFFFVYCSLAPFISSSSIQFPIAIGPYVGVRILFLVPNAFIHCTTPCEFVDSTTGLLLLLTIIAVYYHWTRCFSSVWVGLLSSFAWPTLLFKYSCIWFLPVQLNLMCTMQIIYPMISTANTIQNFKSNRMRAQDLILRGKFLATYTQPRHMENNLIWLVLYRRLCTAGVSNVMFVTMHLNFFYNSSLSTQTKIRGVDQRRRQYIRWCQIGMHIDQHNAI